MVCEAASTICLPNRHSISGEGTQSADHPDDGVGLCDGRASSNRAGCGKDLKRVPPVNRLSQLTEDALSGFAFDREQVQRIRRIEDGWRRLITLEPNIRRATLSPTRSPSFLRATQGGQSVNRFHPASTLFLPGTGSPR